MVIITVAPTGSGPQWRKTPHIPITPSEIAQQVVEAYETGAAVAHIHVRDPITKNPYPSTEMYREVIERIKDRCDIVIQLTTGGGGPYGISLDQRLCSLDLDPEFASLNVATMTFGNSIFLNPPETVERIARIMLQKHIKPEIECYDLGHISLALHLLDKGLLEKPLRLGLVLGVTGGIPAKPENLFHMVQSLPSDCRWNVIVVGKQQFSLLTMGMILGGDVRVGMEDNIHIAKGRLAKSNAELVAKMAKLVGGLGEEIATPAEARKLLGIRNT